jgi:phage internal scaffolding protein
MKLQHRFNITKKPLVKNTQDSLTQQSDAANADINVIIKKYQRTGALEHQAKYEGRYDDIMPTDLQIAMETVDKATVMFNDLPSDVRELCEHDPVKFLEWVQDPQTEQQLLDIGLASEDDLPIVQSQTASQPESGTIQETTPGESTPQ